MSFKYKYLPSGKILDFFQQTIVGLRTSRVNSTILDNILVDAYGSKLHVREVATITIPEPGQLMITPFDKGVLHNISKSILEANIGVNPSDDGVCVRLVFPPLTEETRKQRVKELYKLMEEARISVRNARHDLMKDEKAKKEAGEIAEDEYNRFEKELQVEVDELNKEIQAMAERKEEEIMKV